MNGLAVFSAIFWVLGAACEVDADKFGPDAGPSKDAPGIDADIEPDGSTPRLTWSAPERIAELGTSDDERFATLANSDLSLTFARRQIVGGVYKNVAYRAQRASVDQDFGPAGLLAALADVSAFDLEMRDDELEVFYWTGLGTLSFSERASTEVAFDPPTSLAVSGFSPSLAASDRALYYIDFDADLTALRRARRDTPWSSPISVAIEMPFAFTAIDVADDELSLLVTADPAAVAAGIYVGRRSSVSESFAAPERISALAGPFSNARYSADETEIVFSAPFGDSEELYRSRLIPE